MKMPQVSILYFTGQGFPDPLYAARLLAYTKNTRLEQGADGFAKFLSMPEDELMKELDYISKTLRSSWEFVDFIFQIKFVTRAFTHQLVRTRTASYAQQAQRVVDMSSFETSVPQTVIEVDSGAAWEELMKKTMETYAFYQASGVPNQDCRGVLPTNVFTNIMVKMNLRTLADILGKRKNLRAQGEYGFVAIEMERVALEAMPWLKPFLDPERSATPALDAILRELLGSSSPVDKPNINAALKELDMLKAVWG